MPVSFAPPKIRYPNLTRAKHKLEYSLNDRCVIKKPKIEDIEAVIENLKGKLRNSLNNKKLPPKAYDKIPSVQAQKPLDDKRKDHEIIKLKEHYLSKTQ